MTTYYRYQSVRRGSARSIYWGVLWAYEAVKASGRKYHSQWVAVLVDGCGRQCKCTVLDANESLKVLNASIRARYADLGSKHRIVKVCMFHTGPRGGYDEKMRAVGLEIRNWTLSDF